MSATSPREDILIEAIALITGDRNSQYGPPTQDFERTAALANAFGFRVGTDELQSHHVAIFMMLLKVSRLRWMSDKRDTWADAAGYAGCGYECAVAEGESVSDETPVTPFEDWLRKAFAQLSSEHQPPAELPHEPVVTARKVSANLFVANELLMDMGVIPDTRLYVPPTRRERFRWWRWNQRERLGIWVYERISGETFPTADDF